MRDPKSIKTSKTDSVQGHYTPVQNVWYFEMKVESESRLILDRRIY